MHDGTIDVCLPLHVDTASHDPHLVAAARSAGRIVTLHVPACGEEWLLAALGTASTPTRVAGLPEAVPVGTLTLAMEPDFREDVMDAPINLVARCNRHVCHLIQIEPLENGRLKLLDAFRIVRGADGVLYAQREMDAHTSPARSGVSAGGGIAVLARRALLVATHDFETWRTPISMISPDDQLDAYLFPPLRHGMTREELVAILCDLVHGLSPTRTSGTITFDRMTSFYEVALAHSTQDDFLVDLQIALSLVATHYAPRGFYRLEDLLPDGFVRVGRTGIRFGGYQQTVPCMTIEGGAHSALERVRALDSVRHLLRRIAGEDPILASRLRDLLPDLGATDEAEA